MLIHPMPDPVAIALGPVKIHWYGLMYVVAFVMFLVLGRIRLRQPHMVAQRWTKEELDDVLFYGMLGVIVGGRMGEVLFYQPAHFLANPLDIFKVWEGGMSFHGGLLGVLAAMGLWARKAKRHFMDVMDFVAPLVPLGYAAGRIGNFINAELPGRVADPSLPWAMWWPGVEGLRHPSPLYQALFDGIIPFIILWLFAARARPRYAVAGLYAVLYGCARFGTEYFRVPDWVTQIAGVEITSGQVLSLPLIATGLVFLWIAYRKKA
jgi:phosphatidylglycerol---prolipoprotein diacylglyceryl transferase